MNALVSAIGFSASIVNVTILLPQVIKTLKTRKTRDLSKLTILLSLTSATLWVTYGFFTRTWPIVLANGATIVFMGVLLKMKHRYG